MQNSIKILCFLMLCFGNVSIAFSQDIVGTWRTIDDETEKERSWVEIYKKDDQYFGKIIKVFYQPNEKTTGVCDKCTDYRKNQKIAGLVILENLQKKGDVWSGGKILDPKNGQIYSCKVWLEKDVLKVRGYWGFFYRTQTWYKQK